MLQNETSLKIIPLGGLGEIGKNMTVIRSGDEMIIVDVGLMFPDDHMLGIDLVLPDMTYALENKNLIKAVFLTHGHEDHIGGLPYFLRQIDVPVYGTRLTLGILQGRMKENGVSSDKLHEVQAGQKVTVGVFDVEFLRVNHSIADSVALAINTPQGLIIHTGDFKIDQTPVDGNLTDFSRFSSLGDQGVLALLADSTNAERSEYTKSEKVVGVAFNEIFATTTGRIVLATFSSNVHRIQQAINSATKYNRKVAIIGRSMLNVVSIATELGYLSFPEGTLIDIEEIDKYTSDQILVITTGSQGEPMSALTRMSRSDHRKVSISKGDTVIISATPIPGNEKMVFRTIDHLFKLGAEVIYDKSEGVHVSGHAGQEELKLMHNLVRPKYFIPLHGEYRHLVSHAKIARQLGMAKENIFIAENGSVVEFTKNGAAITGKVPAGKVLVDGLGVGDVGNIVLRDRKLLSQDGIFIVVVTIDKQNNYIVAGPDIVSRGFVYVREAENLMEEAKERIQIALDKCTEVGLSDWSLIKGAVRDSLNRFLYEKTKRRPMILPIVMEV